MSDHGRRKRTDQLGTPADRTKRLRSSERTGAGAHDGHGSPRLRLRHEDYTVGWICALPLEMSAAEGMLDEFHESLPGKHGDTNAYTLGSIASHNIVMACLPGIGTNNAATVAAHMNGSFPSIDKRLMVGIGGAAPDLVDIRLGDVVVGDRVVQYDLGKATPGQFQITAVPTKPPPAMVTAVLKLRASHARKSSQIPHIIDDMVARHPAMFKFKRPATPDVLFEHLYNHPLTEATCQACDQAMLVQRNPRNSPEPVIHYSVIASGNAVIKDGATRNRLSHELQAVCFEMEAAGLGENFPCLVIRGICDYADSHKNKAWQEYAAAVAAAHARDLLLDMPSAAHDLPEAAHGELLDRRQLILDSLVFDEIESRHTSIKAAYRRTCEWFLQDVSYLDWLDPDKLSTHLGFLWISGKPGAGKSTIMKFVHAHTAKTWASASDTAVISFFFNARGAELEKTTEGMYRSLLHQAFKFFPELLPLLDQHVRRYKMQTEDLSDYWTLDMLQDLFQRVVQGLERRRLICFIDALDECGEDQIREMVGFFEDLGETALQNNTGFSICFSSRHYPHIELQRGGLRLTLENQPGHSQDVEKYVHGKLAISRSKAAAEFKELIVEKATGVFMWVVLVVEMLNKELQRGRIADAKRLLLQLPPKLSDLFKDILSREHTNLEDLRLCIQWILYAKRPLTCQEMYFAILSGLTNDDSFPTVWDQEYETLELMRLFILSASKGLAEVVGKRQTVQFIHESVRDFLIKDHGIRELWPDQLDGFDTFSHDRLKTSCLTYARVSSSSPWHFGDVLAEADLKDTPRFDELRSKLSFNYPFLEYATTHLLYHAEQSLRRGKRQVAYPDGINFQRWICINNLYQKFSTRRHDVLTLEPWIYAENNYVNLLKDFSTRVASFEMVLQMRPEDPVFAAIRHGHEAAYRYIRERWPGQINMRNSRGETMLLVAADCGHEHIVRDLLSHPNMNINAYSHSKQTALTRAVKHGYSSIVKRLLSFGGVKVDAETRGGGTALLMAASSGNWAIVDQLLAYGEPIGINRKDVHRPKMTALMYAAEKGAHDTVRRLIAAGADVNTRDGLDRSAVRHAAMHGQLEALRELLRAPGFNIRQTIYGIRTELSFVFEDAAPVEAVREMLAAGAHPEWPEPSLHKPLYLAAKHGRVDVLKEMLRDRRLDDEQFVSSGGRTALSCAVELGDVDVVRELVAHGDDVNHCDTQGFSPATWAAMSGKTEALHELLKSPGLDINRRNSQGRTTLWYAATSRWPETFSLLLTVEGLDLNAQDGDGKTPLMCAVMGGHIRAVNQLVLAGADVNLCDNQGNTPLTEASRLKGWVGTRIMHNLKLPGLVGTAEART